MFFLTVAEIQSPQFACNCRCSLTLIAILIDITQALGYSPLQIAEVLQLLLQIIYRSRLFLNLTSIAGRTLLSYACLNGNTHAVRVSLCPVMSVSGHLIFCLFWRCSPLFWRSMDMIKKLHESKKNASVSSIYL